MYKLLKIFGVITTFAMFLVLMMGALVSKTGSGEGCGDSWPLCHGQLTPIGTIESTIEYSHRAVSGITGLLVIVFALWTWRMLRGKPDIKWLAVTGVFFIFLQAGLGAAAVVWGQSDAVLALHFGFSLISFASVLLLAIRVFQFENGDTRQGSPVSKEFAYATWGIIIYTYIVVYIGAYVSHTGSGMGCSGWPLCNGGILPGLSGEAGIAFGHRVAAALCFFAVGWLALTARKQYRDRKDIYWGSIFAFLLVTLQASSGAFVVLSELHLVALMVHTTIISLLFGALSFLCLQVSGSADNNLSIGTNKDTPHNLKVNEEPGFQ
jgi:cytochrome c oxidase assembly protein subunit 15